jgi:transposase
MLKDCDSFRKVIICCGRVDLRRGIDGLAAYVKLNYGLEPFEKGTLFLFCGTRTDRIKGLVFEGLSADFCYPHTSSVSPVFT